MIYTYKSRDLPFSCSNKVAKKLILTFTIAIYFFKKKLKLDFMFDGTEFTIARRLSTALF